MAKGLALSLRAAIREQSEDRYDSTEILADVGIFTLQKDDVLELLSRRTDMC